MTRTCLSILLLLSFAALQAQEARSQSADLRDARKVLVNKTYSFQQSPKGFGAIREFSAGSQRSPFYFKEERNSTWFILDIPFDGELNFEVRPHSELDDYDWMLFYYTPQLEAEIFSGEAKLLRSNNSRNAISLKGKTGLASGYTNLLAAPGPGNSYSKSLSVKKGQKLALIIDNIYNGGKGFDFVSELKPQVFSTRLLIGKLADKATLVPVAGKVVCEDDETGVLLSESLATASGTFQIEIPVERAVNITATAPEYIFSTSDIEADTANIYSDVLLTKADRTEKLILYNIHFVPDKDWLKTSAEPELERLVALLKQQTDWQIKIVGHTNNNPFADARYLQKLSFNRAITVQQYLTSNGISPKRITCFGVGGKKPLVITKKAQEALKNLRVEIEISR